MERCVSSQPSQQGLRRPTLILRRMTTTLNSLPRQRQRANPTPRRPWRPPSPPNHRQRPLHCPRRHASPRVYRHAEPNGSPPEPAENLYTGPPFGQLDEEVQGMLEQYLDARGINTALALFIPDYIDVKEQKEYLSWLGRVKKFVE